MRLLLDQGISPRTVDALRQTGIDAVHVRTLGLSRADDRQIIEQALALPAAIVTSDSDFHALLAHTGRKLPSVIRIRMEGLRPKDVADELVAVLDAFTDKLTDGAAISVGSRGARCRRLPLP